MTSKKRYIIIDLKDNVIAVCNKISDFKEDLADITECENYNDICIQSNKLVIKNCLLNQMHDIKMSCINKNVEEGE